eukprot:4273794-Pyramimonas_sp.AAC.1
MGLPDAAALASRAQEIEDMPTFPDDERAESQRVHGSPESKYPRTEEGKGSSGSGRGVARLASRAAAAGAALVFGRSELQAHSPDVHAGGAPVLSGGVSAVPDPARASAAHVTHDYPDEYIKAVIADGVASQFSELRTELEEL